MAENENGAKKDGASSERMRKRDRSPSYPGIDLKEAIAKAETLYGFERRHKAPVDVILNHWGYKPKSGAGMVAVAALKKFGLLEDEGSGAVRQAGLSQDGLTYLMDESPEMRNEIIRRAALRPPIHAEVWRKYEGNLPSDATMRSYLKLERGFTESGAAEFIKELKATIDFAKLSPSDSVTDAEADKLLDEGDDLVMDEETAVKERSQPEPGASQTLRAPLGGGRSVVVQMPVRMTAKEWQRFEANLAAWKLTLEDDEE